MSVKYYFDLQLIDSKTQRRVVRTLSPWMLACCPICNQAWSARGDVPRAIGVAYAFSQLWLGFALRCPKCQKSAQHVGTETYGFFDADAAASILLLTGGVILDIHQLKTWSS